ncbi:MAG: hypothetical protein IPP10_06860 [Candidatus Competibacteraceae bacterium]|nr:hypothetical protein [Candidatus Competibacteraceae bacterium]MBK8898210.1 hypothetical protein [Candidatus Competibacteraceae bacterium]MBK8962017.1 hypothetical protein [Candidatus Competibacteraceae bacterium]MBK9951232.1 hypothetical protein [Candidatus Competibacteraceae bacterium]
MATKKFVVELLGADGKGVSGVPVKASGCMELVSSPVGTVLFLTDESQVTVTISGKDVFKAAINAVPDRLVFVQDGGGWKQK